MRPHIFYNDGYVLCNLYTLLVIMLTDIIYFHVSHKYISTIFNNVLFSASFAKFVDIIIGVTWGKFLEGRGHAVVKRKSIRYEKEGCLYILPPNI